MPHSADLTEADTAAALGCAVGTVKRHASDAFAQLRRYENIARARRPAVEERA